MSWQDRLPKRTLLFGGTSAAAVLLILGILIFAGLISQRYYLRWDLTRDRSQSLSAVTKALLKEVNKPLTLTAFYPEGQGERQKAKEVLQNYAAANSNITFAFVDPDRQPLKAKEAGFRYPGNVLVEYDGRRQLAERTDEEAISETLRKLLKPEQKKIYFLTGHGERSLEDNKRESFSTARQALANEGYAVLSLNLLTQGKIPPDAALLVIAGPAKPLFPQEIQALKDYLNRGGRLLVMLEPFEDAGLKDFLSSYGVGLNDGIILDQNQLSQILGASAVMPIAIKYGPHRITQDFTNAVTVFPLARPLEVKTGLPGLSVLPLVSTNPSSWEKVGKDWSKKANLEFDPKKDRQGPFTLAALVEIKLGQPKAQTEKKKAEEAKKPVDDKTAYLVVFGDTDFADNGYFNFNQSTNGDLFLNTVNFLAAEEKQIVIRRAEQKSQPLTLTRWQAWMLFLASIVLIPLVMLVAGLANYFRRRARR